MGTMGAMGIGELVYEGSIHGWWYSLSCRWGGTLYINSIPPRFEQPSYGSLRAVVLAERGRAFSTSLRSTRGRNVGVALDAINPVMKEYYSKRQSLLGNCASDEVSDNLPLKRHRHPKCI